MAQDSPPTVQNQTLLLPCHECDLVCEVNLRQDGRWVQCPRCRHPLMRQAQNDQLTPALAFTALILLGLSLLFSASLASAATTSASLASPAGSVAGPTICWAMT